ncbi:diacylglycerol kinase catalytic region [Actinosynnema mirum DSM 43827]|uniref:Diacylglycerol kinase catalytic region n=1 Tax=Actinosynnema mirum (strain ATCC 29888 / DSM 43827 / JCM 3225 / NBRC 14064 / NCIMB 13271 / NRRL B-12336 / IMRU 3971 / 101) TaxID=446462 RepID=C6WIF0_ACTMD|nr:diacylglycerol kinase catalytic region [Actinosynnema mirum DSM 43827]
MGSTSPTDWSAAVTRAALLVSPNSGGGAAARIAGTTAALLRESVDVLDLLVPTSTAEAAAMAERVVGANVDALVVLGGDGAAHVALQACAGTPTALAVIPAGTGNDLARALGSRSAADLVPALRSGERRRVDLGRVRGGRWFATVLCAGFDSAVNARANRMRWPAGPRRYDLALLAELLGPRPGRLLLGTPKGEIGVNALLVAVGNTGSYGGGVPVCPGADPEDGLFDVTVVEAVSRRTLLRVLPTLRTGDHTAHPAVHTFRASSIRLAGPAWTAYADGERQRALPVTATCVPGALSTIPSVLTDSSIPART